MGVQVNDCYKSISAPSEGIYKDKGSKFLAFAYPVESESEIKDILLKIKKEYFDARHHCYAYRLKHDYSIWRANDDGEPSSSAGRPILGQILSNELSDILIVVVRYFGGIKLGVPGLIKAYKSATTDVLENSEIITKIASKRLSLHFGYLAMNDVMKKLKEFNITPEKQEFDNECKIILNIRLSEKDRFIEAVEKYANVQLDQ
jgi:uncharacterized YigZ family protein